MTLQRITEALALIADTYELAAPPGATRAIVWHEYGRVTLIGDDAVLTCWRKIQLDLFYQSTMDALPDDVMAALSALSVPYSVQDIAYDPDYALMRCIIQLEAL